MPTGHGRCRLTRTVINTSGEQQITLAYPCGQTCVGIPTFLNVHADAGRESVAHSTGSGLPRRSWMARAANLERAVTGSTLFGSRSLSPGMPFQFREPLHRSIDSATGTVGSSFAHGHHGDPPAGCPFRRYNS
ncbi:hypothetical protein [Paraburkholderia fynbosensis]|uniref:Uncharacterized protein n=1 Tax=Paraburkholderia fynbosensis TaxID=1200993 RepID=A0A6J5GFT5_9BURK|nr:hypothetical protein [Paraburkholderia fynbosensis]CAB3796100.1 hypothetical protein LMG27177_04031 [Paraburkholderia fynbosensis]